MSKSKTVNAVACLITIISLFSADIYSQDPTQDGINCLVPIVIDLDGQTQYPVIRNDFTCGKFDDYQSTCLQTYDGGEDIVYEINVMIPLMYEFALDPLGSPWTGMALSADCPPSGSEHPDCLAYSIGQSSPDPHAFSVFLDVGTYYLMIDTWPAPDCIPGFELTILPSIIPPPKCQSPMQILMPDDSPYNDCNQFTCGRLNEYSSTCMASYDGGEEMVYEVVVSSPGSYSFGLDPKSTTFTGMALGAVCPPAGSGHQDCLAISTFNMAEPHGFVVELEPGNYYLMIDTWPSPECIPDYDLTVYKLPPEYICGDANWDAVVGISDAIYIINYVFAGGDTPDPYESGDVSCDGMVNVSDAVWIINYIFMGGYSPCDIDGDGMSDC